MKHRLLCLLLVLTMLIPAGNHVLAVDTDIPVSVAEEVPAENTPHFTVNGVAYEDPNLCVYDQVTYVSMVYAIKALRPDATITWDGDHALATAPGLTLTARPGDFYIQVNGRCLPLDTEVFSVNGALMLPIRTVATALSAGIIWNSKTGIVELYRGAGSIQPGDTYYNQDDLYWLSHIINAESGNQPLDGKLAVGAVVMNRVRNPQHPNTIKGVVFAPNQFTPARNGAIYKTPNAESVIAAKLCLEGLNVDESILFFLNPQISSCTWAARNRTYVMTIANHAFYA